MQSDIILREVKVKVKRSIAVSGSYLTATGNHMPYVEAGGRRERLNLKPMPDAATAFKHSNYALCLVYCLKTTYIPCQGCEDSADWHGGKKCYNYNIHLLHY